MKQKECDRFQGTVRGLGCFTIFSYFGIMSTRDVHSKAITTLKWTGVGEMNEYHRHQNYSPFPGCHINQQIWEQYRSASVSGTVSDGTTNFTPEPTTSADMQFTKTISTSQGCE